MRTSPLATSWRSWTWSSPPSDGTPSWTPPQATGDTVLHAGTAYWIVAQSDYAPRREPRLELGHRRHRLHLHHPRSTPATGSPAVRAPPSASSSRAPRTTALPGRLRRRRRTLPLRLPGLPERLFDAGDLRADFDGDGSAHPAATSWPSRTPSTPAAHNRRGRPAARRRTGPPPRPSRRAPPAAPARAARRPLGRGTLRTGAINGVQSAWRSLPMQTRPDRPSCPASSPTRAVAPPSLAELRRASPVHRSTRPPAPPHARRIGHPRRFFPAFFHAF
ncbi:MAG: hypothetical protein KatS3mg103_1263 [Phycisphaerales bacterium]|nr:MAG: hypothetical protein KatS3mg103_1263 [Phycisphaerales bacterium]